MNECNHPKYDPIETCDSCEFGDNPSYLAPCATCVHVNNNCHWKEREQ